MEQEVPRDFEKQVQAGIAHMNVMADFIKKVPGTNDENGRKKRKQTIELLKEINGYSGRNRIFAIFKPMIEEGVGTMNRLFGSDILHTWVLGFVEAAVGFTLQILKFIGHSNVDKAYSQSAKKLIEIVKCFPPHNALQPMKKHVCFVDIYEMFQSDSNRKGHNSMHTTGHLKMREGNNLPCALLQIFFALADEELLPSDFLWCKNKGFGKPYFSPRQVVINAINAVLEVHWHLKAPSLCESQLNTLQMLISNAQGHMLLLDVMRKRIVHKASSLKSEYVDLEVTKVGLMNNVKFEMLTHFVEGMRQCGCDNNVRDTEHGEMLMKLCKVLFSDTNRRYSTVLKDMLRKYMHLQYMAIARKGMEDAHIKKSIGIDARKAHNKSTVICRDEEREFKTNSSYAQQHILWNSQRGEYRTKSDGDKWKVHPMLLLVRFLVLSVAHIFLLLVHKNTYKHKYFFLLFW